ncbi:MAG TPA: putative porin [Verrucomicrobiae bacterium]|nr:putative porin [Verrucomicrobiae bacterium]
MRGAKGILLFVCGVLASSGTASADVAVSPADFQAMAERMDRMETIMKGMSETIRVQGERIVELEGRSGGVQVAGEAATAPMPGDQSAFQENLKKEIGDYKWLKGMRQSGDLRLRYEATNEQHNSALNDRNRFRFRLRYQIEKDFGDDFTGGLRLVSGARNYDPTAGATGETIGQINSTNQTFDNNFDYKAISIDKAWATYTPGWAVRGPVKKFEVTGGKWKNPFEEGSSVMIWDRDVTPEGIYEQALVKGFETENWKTDFVATAGQMVLEEGSGTFHDDAELWAVQGGLKHEISVRGLAQPVEVKNLMSYYNYSDFTRVGNFQAAAGNPACAGGTTLCAGDFDVLETYNEAGFLLGPLPKMTLFFDWAANLNEMAASFDGAAQAAGMDDAWGTGLKLGGIKKKGSWEAAYEYYNIEPNSVPGIFSESDFGGADRRGSVVRLSYALTNNLVFNSAAFFTNRVTGGGINPDNEREVFQADLVWKI